MGSVHARRFQHAWRGLALAVVLVAGTPLHARAQTDSAQTDSAPKPRPRFFKNLPYGSDMQFNPLSVVANHWFDELRTGPRTDITKNHYRDWFHGVVRTVVHPDRGIRNYGMRNWLRDEIFPLTLKSSGGGQWYPNYTMHLFGSGVPYLRLIDWYRDHGIESHPELAAGLTHFTYHFLVEMDENGAQADRGVDALSDLLVFDVASLVLWNQDFMRRWFSGSIEITDWNGQVSYAEPGRTIENAYAMFVVRAPIPRTSDWKVLVTHGLMFLVGVSRRVGDDGWITLGAGTDAVTNPIVDANTGKKTATFEPNFALFVDRGGSLLLSVVDRGGSNNGPTLNVYPGVIGRGNWSPGLWIQQNRGGGVRFGVSSRLGIGLSTARGVH